MHKCTYRSNTITRIRQRKQSPPGERGNGVYTPGGTKRVVREVASNDKDTKNYPQQAKT